MTPEKKVTVQRLQFAPEGYGLQLGYSSQKPTVTLYLTVFYNLFNERLQVTVNRRGCREIGKEAKKALKWQNIEKSKKYKGIGNNCNLLPFALSGALA